MNRQFERYLQITLVLLDIIVLNTVYMICQVLLLKSVHLMYTDPYFQYWAVSNGIWLLISIFFRTYAIKVILNFEYYIKRTIQVYLVWIICVLVYLFFSRAFDISRIFILCTLVSFGLGLLINRFLYLGIKNIFK